LSNLFGDLSKHLSGRHEDFLTNSFVYLLNYFLENEKPSGTDLLNFICFKNEEIAFSEEEAIVITTQKFTDVGTPDIGIRGRSDVHEIMTCLTDTFLEFMRSPNVFLGVIHKKVGPVLQ